jgi:hypothetical protein
VSNLRADGELAVFYTQEIDVLSRDLSRLGKDVPGTAPFRPGVGALRLEARRDRSLLPQLMSSSSRAGSSSKPPPD